MGKGGGGGSGGKVVDGGREGVEGEAWRGNCGTTQLHLQLQLCGTIQLQYNCEFDKMLAN